MSKQSQKNIGIPQIDSSFSIVLKRKILRYSIAELFWHLTLIDGGSAMWLNTRPLPHNPTTRSWKAPMYIKTANTLPAISSNMTHARQHWPQQWLNLFDGKNAWVFIYIGQPPRLPVCCVRHGRGLWSHRGRREDAVSWGVWREAAILAALVVQDTWAESHKRVLDQEQLMAKKDEYAAALWVFWFDAKGGAEVFELKAFWIRTILCLSETTGSDRKMLGKHQSQMHSYWRPFSHDTEIQSHLMDTHTHTGTHPFCITNTATATDPHVGANVYPPPLPLRR